MIVLHHLKKNQLIDNINDELEVFIANAEPASFGLAAKEVFDENYRKAKAIKSEDF